MASERVSVRWRVVRALFEVLYANPWLYWLASTLPFAGQWRRWQRLVLPRLHGTRVLEIGCGPGNLLIDLVQAGYSCSAVERSSQMVAVTRRRLRRHHLQDTVSMTQGVAQRLDFPDASFDSVVSTFPTDYIYDPLTLAEISRVLAPSGKLIIVLGATLLPANFLLLPLVALAQLVYGGRSSSGRTAGDFVTAPTAGTSGALLQDRLQSAQLGVSVELVRSSFWVAVVCTASKAG